MKERRMDTSVFGRLLDELDGNSLKTLKEKNARYSRNNDSLHNFRAGASITGKTPAETCWGYASKHFIALRDMVDANDFSNREDFLEKCQDAINYIRFLWCIGNDEEFWKNQDKPIAGEIDATRLKTNKIGSPESMWEDITVYMRRPGMPDEVVYHYTLDCEAQVEDHDYYFVVYYADDEGNDAECAYMSSERCEYYYKINNRNVTKGLPETVTVYCNGKVCNFFNNVDRVSSDEYGFTVYLTEPGVLPYRFNYEIDNYTYKINNRKDK